MEELINDPRAPEVYVSEAAGLVASFGNVHMTFATLRGDHSGAREATRHVTLRVVMPMHMAHKFAGELFDYVKQSGFVSDEPVQ